MIKEYLLRIVNTLRWQIDAICFRLKLRRGLYAPQIFDAKGKYLVIAAHADDEAIGSYSLLKKAASNATVLYFKQYGGNRSSKVARKRDVELKEMCRKLCVNYQDVDSFCVKELSLYDYIFIPSIFDWHDEHINIVKRTIDALDIDKNILFYQETVPIPNKMITDVIPMSRSFTIEKWATIRRIYKSQSNLPWDRFYNIDYAHGSLSSSYAAEVFARISKSDILKMLQYRERNITSFYGLKSSINSIKNITMQVNLLYDEYCEQKR